MMSNNRNDSHQLSEINIIPLVDIMLVLLIIFMVAAPMLQQGIDIDLPEVNAASVSSNKEDLILSINGKGQLYLGDEKKISYSLENIEDKLKNIFENKKKKEIYLRADKSIRYGYVVQVMALCQNAGIERVGMITESEDDNNKKK